jgi:homospermidine synthase
MAANEVFKQVLKTILNACNGLPHVLKLSIQCNAVHIIKNVFVVSFYVTDAMHWLETTTTGAVDWPDGYHVNFLMTLKIV